MTSNRAAVLICLAIAGAALAVPAMPAAMLSVAAAPAAAHDPHPTLVVAIIVDQLPAGTLEAIRERLSGGLRRFLDAGRRFTRCRHEHAITETGPGHATLLSGLHPSHHGIIANEWHDRGTGHDVYCVAGEAAGAPLGFDGSDPVDAEHLRGENLADLIKRTNPASKVYAVTGKDRSAVLTAGHHADGVLWFSQKTAAFTSNPRLMRDLPSWGADFFRPGPAGAAAAIASGIPGEWSYPIRKGWGPDDVAAESPVYSRVAPHPLMTAAKPPAGPASAAPTASADSVSEQAKRIFASPWVDWMTIELARRVLEREALGADPAADLLVVGLSGVDVVGHAYGPASQEYLDALIRIDGWLAPLLAEAERHRRAGDILFVLTSDHGVLPLPELLAGARRVDDSDLRARLEKGLAARLMLENPGPLIESMRGSELYLDHRALERLRVPLDAAMRAARLELSTYGEIARVYDAPELSAPSVPPDPNDPFLQLNRNSYDPDRGGDLVIQPCDRCLFSSRPYGTGHGTPYPYDRDVPMILLGRGFAAGEDGGECRTVDLAPTIAARLGMTFDAPRDGRDLLAAPSVDSAPSAK